MFGPGHLYSARPSFSAPAGSTEDDATLDFRTGGSLTVAGDLPMVVSRRVVDERGLDLLRQAGIELPTDLRVYDDERGYLAAIARPQERVVLQHVHPPHEIDPDRCWISPSVLSYLNNKARLPELAPTEHVPRRTVISTHRATSFDDDVWDLPVVIKVATEESVTGGWGVRLCRTAADVRSAMRDFAWCDTLVVEEFLSIKRTFCVQFSTSHADGPERSGRPIRYLGAPEQITDASGRYIGNWLEPFRDVPDTVVDIGQQVMNQAVALGFVGFAGTDIAQLDDDRFMILDLNFRLNGSTAPLLLSSAVAEEYDARVMCFIALMGRDGWDELVQVAERAVRNRSIVPLSTYRPRDHSGDRPRLAAMIPGATRADVMSTQDQLGRLGLQ